MGAAPRSRAALIVREVGDEALVYDPDTHRASCLNREAALALRACDGRRDAAAVAAWLSRRLGRTVDARYARLAIDRLRRARLLEDAPRPLSPGRREALRRLAAAAALALPTVTTVLAPDPAQAQTCLPNGQPCTSSSQCCSGCCNPAPRRCTGGSNCLP